MWVCPFKGALWLVKVAKSLYTKYIEFLQACHSLRTANHYVF